MKLNLGPEIEREIADIMDKFEADGWTKEDLNYAWKEDGDGDCISQSVTVTPMLLYYTADLDIPQVVVWYQLRFAWLTDLDEVEKLMAQAMVTKLKAWGLTPFHDQDVELLGHFRYLVRQEAAEGWTTYACAVNPSYPKGLSENHTL